MKLSLICLSWLLSAALSLAASADSTIRLPGTKSALSAETTIAQFRSAMPEPQRVQIEELSNDQAFAVVPLSYRIEVEFYKNVLRTLTVGKQKRDSKFARWFDKQVTALPLLPDSLQRPQPGANKRILHERTWRSSTAEWTSGDDADQLDQMIFKIRFLRDDTTLANKHKSNSDSTLRDTVASAMEIPPSPIDSLCPQPKWPFQAVEKDIDKGRVVAQVYIDKFGMVRKWRIVKIDPVGFGFAQEVEYVLRYWKFRPAIQQGEPVGVWIAVPFTFRR